MDEQQEKILVWAEVGIALAVMAYFLALAFRRSNGPQRMQAIPVIVVNPDGRPVQFGHEPLIQTDGKD